MKIIQEHYPIVATIVKKIHANHARAYLVGGVVRDIVMKKPIKDVDIEVHGMTEDALETLLRQHGVVSIVGKSFGVLRLHGLDVDWSLPRSDSAGRKPAVVINPDMTIHDALKRRDLTMNAMAIDMKTDELIDPFGGMNDIKNKVLKTPDVKLFVEDPLRFYRVMQFISRFEMFPSNELNDLCAHIDISGVSRERIEQEFKKLLLLSARPSLGIRWLQLIGRLSTILPELAATVNVQQNPQWHPEGSVFEHSMQALDAAADLVHSYDNEHNKLVILYAALCHDLGKATTTIIRDGAIKSYGHEQENKHARAMLRRITHDNELISCVISLIENHMIPLQLIKQKSSLSAYKRLANRLYTGVSIKLLTDLLLADRRGRNGDSHEPLADAGEDVHVFIKNAQKAKVFDKREAPILLGVDLLPYIKAGPQIGRLLARAYDIQINEDISDKRVLLERVIGKKEK